VAPAAADARIAALQRRTLLVLSLVQVAGGIGFFVGITVIALLARDLSGSAALAGLPPALGIAASALAAAPVSAWMAHRGRRPGLVAGHLCAAAGCLVVLAAARTGNFGLLCAGTAAFGLGNTSNLLARYAAADLSGPERRGRAISLVLLATTLGAVAGPNLASATKPLGPLVGVPELAGPFLVSTGAFLLAAAGLTVFLRPDPLLVARDEPGLAIEGPGTDDSPRPTAALTAWPPLARVALGTLVMVNVAMIAIMTMTPLHLDHAGQSLTVVGIVISLHVMAMFLPSPLTGWLTDRVGRIPLIAAASVTLIAAGVLGAVSSGDQAVPVTVALVLLGLAWNLGLISASTLLTDAVAPARRPRAQGTADLAMGVAGAMASAGSGAVLAAGGFAALALAGAGFGLALGALAASARLVAARA
jgi:MFS family permease